MPGSVWFRDDFDAAPSVEALKGALGGWGTDEDAVIKILGNHNWQQRMEIAESYKAAYGASLIDDMKSELTGDFEDVTVAMLTEPVVLYAQEIHEAISGAGTDETTLVEVLATKTNEELERIKEKYKELYEVEMEEDLASDTSGYFRRLMISLVSAGRQEDIYANVDYDKAREDAQKFLDAGESRWGTDEEDLNAILCLRSRPQLKLTFREFEDLAGKTIEESIADECSGDLQEGYLAVVESIKDESAFFAKRIRDCVEGLGTKDSHLIRIIVTRSEVDMEEIDQIYTTNYETSLAETIESECSGDYKRMLLALVTMQE